MRNQKLTSLLDCAEIVVPSLLGQTFQIANDDAVYLVIGTRWRSKEVVLKDAMTDRILTMQGKDFIEMARAVVSD